MTEYTAARDRAIPAAEKLGRIKKLLDDSGIDIAEVGRIDKVRIGEHEMVTKDADGEAHVHKLRADSLYLTPGWDSGPAWPVVQPAAPVTVKPTTAKRETVDGWLTAMILPDVQIGFRLFEDGTLDPFHDEQAMGCALKVLRHVRPDLVVNLGDLLDLPAWSRFEQEPAFQRSTQPALDRAHRFLAEQRANAPEAEIVLLEGNHDRRLQKAIVKNAQEAFGLRRAEAPDSWPVLSVPHLLRLDDLDVEYVDGYPAAQYWINDNVVAIHGHKVRSAGSTAAAVVDDQRVSTIFGHVHRTELQLKTRHTREGPKHVFAATPGCLARIDGGVPSTKSSTDSHGRPVGTTENWNHGFAVMTYQPGDGGFSLPELGAIYDGETTFRGRRFVA